jgi:RNA polymerase sigma-70 factor (ECF subfamily)
MAGWLMLPAMAEEPDDRTLMVGYRDGDIAAFEVLYARHKDPLYRYFLRHGMSRDKASDLFQEVWTKIIRAKDRYQPTAKFTTYMYRLAHNCYVDEIRRQGRTPVAATGPDAIDPEEISGESGDDPERKAEQSEAVARFRTALAKLPPDQREAFVLREEGGLSLADIAAVTGVSAETAKSRLRYAVRKLRDVLMEAEDST